MAKSRFYVKCHKCNAEAMDMAMTKYRLSYYNNRHKDSLGRRLQQTKFAYICKDCELGVMNQFNKIGFV